MQNRMTPEDERLIKGDGLHYCGCEQRIAELEQQLKAAQVNEIHMQQQLKAAQDALERKQSG